MKKNSVYRAAAALLACLQLAGCGSAAASAPASDSTVQSSTAPSASPAAPDAAAQADANPLRAEWPVLYDTALTPAVPAFTVEADFSNLINADEMEYWSDSAKQMLLKNGFVVMNNSGNEFYEHYEYNRYAYIPNYVTVDSLLHTYHLYYQYLQRGVEEKELAPMLESLSVTLLNESTAQYEALKGTEWENAALRNMAFFGVGSTLLNPNAATPAAAADLAAEELALIDSAAGVAASPLMNLNAATGDFTVQEDYSQYIPRSYYTQSKTLERYFKAMMWYGRMGFLQTNEDLNRSALLMTLALKNSGATEDWQRLYDITAFFAGTSDDPGYNDYAPLLAAAYGGDITAAALAGSTDGWDLFVKNAAALTPAAVNSMPILNTDDRADTALAFRFLGQRFTFDATIFSNLTYRNVEEAADGSQRLMPDALDLPAALGSDLAVKIMDEAGLTDYPNYTAQLEKTRTALSQAPTEAWQASLYGGWLDTLRPLAETKADGTPQFMQTEAWATRNLSSLLGSWTELKHDSALYAKQNYAEMGGGGDLEIPDDRGYVEAEPVVFGRLAALTRVTSDGLKALNVLGDASAENLDRMYELNLRLMQIAEKELKNELPSDDDFELIRSIGGQLEHFWTEVMAENLSADQSFSPLQMPAALVADVSTDPNGSVLQVGTDVGVLYVIVNVDGKLRLASGTVYDFFEFEQPMAERMTDQAWWVALGKTADENGEYHWKDRPSTADWTRSFALRTFYE